MQLPGRNQSDGTAGSPGNPTGRIRIEAENYSAQDGVQTENCGDVGGTLNVGYIDPGNSITYDVAAPVSGLYTINFRLANDGSPATFQVRNSAGTVLATVNVPYTYGWQNYITLSASVTLPAGQQSLQLYCLQNNWNINWLELLPPATGSGGFNGSGAYHIEAEDFIAQNGTLLENCQDAGGTYNIGSINSGDWLDYRVNMPVGGSYQLSLRAASGNGGANTVQLLSATGTVLATLSVSNTGSYQSFATYTANISLPAGVQTLRLAVTGGYMAVNWLELAAPNSTVPLDNYALVLNNNFNYTGGMVYEAENTFTVEFMVKPKVAHEIDVESTSGFSGTEGQKYVMFPVQGGSEADSRAGMGISVGTNGVSVYEHADGYMPALLVWAYPIDTVWTHVAVVYHNGKPSLYINGVWKKDGLQSLRQHVYPGTMFPGGYYGSQGDGILDEVRIWSVARTPEQIAANKDGELTGPQTGLVGYWPMNEGTGLTLHDVSGSGRDVDLTSAGYTSASWTNGRYSVASIIGSYRYAFNGKEKDSDIGEDDYDFGARIYDARIGRWLSTDPLAKSYPFLTPYNFVANSPITFLDIDGEYFDLSKLSTAQRKQFDAQITKATANDPYLKTIYKALSKDRNLKITITVNSNINVGGIYKPVSQNAGSITFKSLTAISDDKASTNEEMFHAYQQIFYGYAKFIGKAGGSNFEFEPRFIKAIKQLEATADVNDNAYNFLSDYKDFIKSIQPNQKSLTDGQKKKYLALVEAFRAHYEKENKENGTNNKYDDPAIDVGPDAAFSIINIVHQEGQKATQDESDVNVVVTFKRKTKPGAKDSSNSSKDSTKTPVKKRKNE